MAAVIETLRTIAIAMTSSSSSSNERRGDQRLHCHCHGRSADASSRAHAADGACMVGRWWLVHIFAWFMIHGHGHAWSLVLELR